MVPEDGGDVAMASSNLVHGLLRYPPHKGRGVHRDGGRGDCPANSLITDLLDRSLYVGRGDGAVWGEGDGAAAWAAEASAMWLSVVDCAVAVAVFISPRSVSISVTSGDDGCDRIVELLFVHRLLRGADAHKRGRIDRDGRGGNGRFDVGVMIRVVAEAFVLPGRGRRPAMKTLSALPASMAYALPVPGVPYA